MLVLWTSILAAWCAGDPPTPSAPPAPTVPPVPSVPAAPASPGTGTPSSGSRVVQLQIAGTALSLELVEVASESGGKALWFGRTEIPWEVLDVFVHGLDTGASTPESDAVTRPSKPYISMDRGFGHHGHPAISVSRDNAVEFCRWLSAKSKGSFRLPTRAEWSAACARGQVPAERRLDFAWLKENAERKTHPVASRQVDAAGLFDMIGNACEWASDGDAFVVMGGSYRDGAATVECSRAVPEDKNWNQSDPQIPRGRWWLADGGFVGFRVVCEQLPKEISP